MATLTQVITRVLNRSNLAKDGGTGTSDQRDQARMYLSMVSAEIVPMTNWWWLDKTTTFKTTRTLTVTGISGTFQAGEEIRDAQSSYYSATIDSIDTTNSLIYVYSENSVTPTGTLTGQTSSATCTFSSRAFTRTYQPVSGNVTAWHSFINETDDRVLFITGPDEYDSGDLDRSDSGTVDVVFVGALDATTGYPLIELGLTPSSTNETIRVRYRQDIAEWTSSNDSSQMAVLGLPRTLENVLIHGAAAMYLEENGDDTGAAREFQNYARLLNVSKRQNLDMQGNRKYAAVDGYEDLVLNIGTSLVVE